MRHDIRIIASISAALALLAVAPALGQVALDRRYRDPLHGFSLRPPAGTERRREFSASRLVTWVRSDPKSGAIAWTLTVHRGARTKEDIKLEAFAKELPKQLLASDRFFVDKKSVRVLPVAKKGAIQLEGVMRGAVRLWQRQVWVLARPRRFLVFTIRGPEADKDKLRKIFDAVAKTIIISDPKAEREAREENLKRGRELLSELEDAKIKAVIHAAPQWFLLRLKDKDVGFMKQTESARKHKGSAGWEVVTWVMMRLPKDKLRLQKRVLFTTTDRSLERWREQLQVGEGAGAITLAEDGMKQADLIVCNVGQNRRIDTKRQKVPKKHYLPRAMTILMPRLIDASKASAYAFATYTTQANAFDMRTFTVIGPETITLGGRRVKAVRMTDQPAADAEAVTLWVNKKGLLLRMQTSEGVVMEQTSEGAILRRFPKAKAALAAMRQWARQP